MKGGMKNDKTANVIDDFRLTTRTFYLNSALVRFWCDTLLRTFLNLYN
jgi:hypothetical protein